ncbi:MAG: hypothetical protein U9Q66_02315 [Patescibacteria group bacterium]|nr:hypothetical protein [Patescibacteria group bacterium]
MENYFHDTKTIEKVLEFIAINKISINNPTDLTEKLQFALEDIGLLVSGKKQEKKAKDFLDEL